MATKQTRDFVDVVQGFLDRGEVFQPANKFVSELSLCPRVRGGPDQRNLLKDLLFRMASLVKETMAARRNRKRLQEWLRTVAKDLDTFQIVSRDWINQHVWDLGALPKPKEQNYDPMAGRRDYRFYSATGVQEAAMLDPTEEMGTDLDYCATEDEDQLLYSSEKSASASPPRSPSLFPSPTSVARLTAEIPRSPRFDEAQQSQEPSISSSQMEVFAGPVVPLAVSYSPVRVSRIENNPREQQRRGLGREGPLKRKNISSVDTRTKQARSGNSKDRRQSRWEDSRAYSSVSTASPSVPQEVSERQDPEVRKKRSNAICWVPGCMGPARYLKAHAFFEHLPSIFDERLEPSDEGILCGRRNALKQAGRWLMGRPVELDQLLSFVKIQKLLIKADNTEVTQTQETAMQEFCRFLHQPIPQQFILDPGNSVGILLHWKALLLIAASLTEEERDYWRENFHAQDFADESEYQQVVQPRNDPEAFDSHFHLDRTLRKMHLPDNGSVDDILKVAPVEDNKRIYLVGAIAIYCDPDTYPSERYLDQLPENISVGIGYHPKHASDSRRKIDQGVRHLQRLLRHPRVVAFGEVGLDHTEPHRHWSYQLELLEKVLPYLEDRHVLVIHCRGMDDDCGTEAFFLLRHFLKKKVRRDQSIHLHCFTGNSYVLRRWLEVFPRTYFGFTNKVKKFDQDQIEALCEIDENRLLLESDAPYFPMEGRRVSSPSQLYVLAEAMAEHRQLTVERMLEVTVANARHLYQEQQ